MTSPVQSHRGRVLRFTGDGLKAVFGPFEVDAQPPLAIKGVDAPMQSWLVRRAKPRADRRSQPAWAARLPKTMRYCAAIVATRIASSDTETMTSAM